MGFQSQVNVQQAIGVEGDWASANPRYSAIAGPGGFVAGPGGVRVGSFVWSVGPVDQDGTDTVVVNYGSGLPIGFIHRDQQALNTVYLSEAGMIIPEGQIVTVMSSGEFLMKNSGAVVAEVGMKAYARYGDGAVVFAAAGAPGSASATGTIAAATNGWTASIDDDIMTVTAVSSGILVNGTKITGAGVIANTRIERQLFPLEDGETVHGVGRYVVDTPEQSVPSEAMTGAYGLFTAVSALSGAFSLGDTLSGTNVTAGNKITEFGTGTGGLGTYYVSIDDTATSTTISAGTTIETKYTAKSVAAVGGLAKTSPINQI